MVSRTSPARLQYEYMSYGNTKRHMGISLPCAFSYWHLNWPLSAGLFNSPSLLLFHHPALFKLNPSFFRVLKMLLDNFSGALKNSLLLSSRK